MFVEEKKLLTAHDGQNDEKIRATPFRQTPGLCGPAAIKILLSRFGKQGIYSEEQLTHLCSTTLDAGTEHEGLIQGIKWVGGYVFAKEEGSIEELEYFIKEERLPVIIGWFDPLNEGDHYSVVVNITEKNIIIVDPSKFGPERWLERETFPNLWFDFIGKDNRTVSWRWYMVVVFEKKKFPKIKGGYYY